MDEYFPFLSKSDSSSFDDDETSPSDKNLLNQLSAENSEITLHFDSSHYTRSSSLNYSAFIPSDSFVYEASKLTSKKNIPKCSLKNSFHRNSFDLFDSQVKFKDKLTIHKSDTFNGKKLEKKSDKHLGFVPNFPITNNRENLYSMEPKYYSTPIHFNNLQPHEKKLENQLTNVPKEKNNSKHVLVKNLVNTRIMPKKDVQVPRRENVNFSIHNNMRVYPSKFLTTNQQLNYDSVNYFKNLAHNYQQKVYESSHKTQHRNLEKQKFLYGRRFYYDMPKMPQNQSNYPYNFQMQYYPNILNLTKFPNYNFANWTNYLIPNNLYQQTILNPKIQRYLWF